MFVRNTRLAPSASSPRIPGETPQSDPYRIVKFLARCPQEIPESPSSNTIPRRPPSGQVTVAEWIRVYEMKARWAGFEERFGVNCSQFDAMAAASCRQSGNPDHCSTVENAVSGCRPAIDLPRAREGGTGPLLTSRWGREDWNADPTKLSLRTETRNPKREERTIKTESPGREPGTFPGTTSNRPLHRSPARLRSSPPRLCPTAR